ncbi:MAG: hypothetical protein QOE72_4733 [Chloroflexota bacterium]|jgi:hypothetical protein|nr:hypothetical protein [Chloroflexota bacterium]
MTDAATLQELLRTFQRSAWRLEARDRYQADDQVRAYLRGDPTPPPMTHSFAKYLENLRAMPAQGRTIGRVHAIVGPLSPYLRYELEWGYSLTAEAGDDVHILHRPRWEDTLFGAQPSDFWIFDDAVVAVMNYADNGDWLGLELVREADAVAEYRAIQQLALRDAIALRAYLTVLRTTPIDPTALLSRPETIAR